MYALYLCQNSWPAQKSECGHNQFVQFRDSAMIAFVQNDRVIIEDLTR